MQAKNGEKIEPEEGEAITEDLACVSSIDKVMLHINLNYNMNS